MTRSLCIAHLTDLHLRKLIPGSSAVGQRQSRLMSDVLVDALLFFRELGADLVCCSGDLVDVPFPLDEQDERLLIQEYQAVKSIFDAAELPYVIIPGNHDEHESFFSVFARQPLLEIQGYEIHSFVERQVDRNPVWREGEGWQRFLDCCRSEGPRNQIHLQHYLISPEKNDGFPHTYENGKELLRQIDQGNRLLLSLSGHYHRGADVQSPGGCRLLTSQALCEGDHPFSLIRLSGENIEISSHDMAAQRAQSAIHFPYYSSGEWLRGNLHAHCSENSSCSSSPLSNGVGRYANIESDFLAITDHDCISDISEMAELHPELMLLKGFEHSKSNHMLFIGDHPAALYEIADKAEALEQASDLLTIACHPQGPARDYWTVSELAAFPRQPDGIEVFNGHYAVGNWRHRGCGWEYTEFWQNCLDAGLPYIAYANDDFHDDPLDFNNGWNMVLSQGRSKTALLEALKRGSCYASTGIIIQGIHEYRGLLMVQTEQNVNGRFIGPDGQILACACDNCFEYRHQNEAYIRFEAELNGKRCWAQACFARH